MGDASSNAAVRVLVCEAGPPVDGSLYSILEAAGFDLVGLLATTDSLERILPIMDPNVLVLDSGAGAMALLAARELAPHVGVVVVWPAGTRAETADQFVDPSQAATELAPAVLMASRRHQLSNGPTIVGADLRVVPGFDPAAPLEPSAPVDPVLEPASAVAGVTAASRIAVPRTVVPAAALASAASGAAAATPATPIASVSRLRARASVSLVAACVMLALVVAITSRPMSPSVISALPPGPSAVPSATPGGPSGNGGNGGNGQPPSTGPLVGNPPAFGLSALGLAPAVMSDNAPPGASGTETGGTPAVANIVHRREVRHRRRHRVRHRKRQRRDGGGQGSGGDGGSSNGGSSNGPGGSGGPGTGPSAHDHPAHPDHPAHHAHAGNEHDGSGHGDAHEGSDHGNSSHGNSDQGDDNTDDD